MPISLSWDRLFLSTFTITLLQVLSIFTLTLLLYFAEKYLYLGIDMAIIPCIFVEN